MKRLALLIPILAIAACATPETRVKTSLINAGLPQKHASCMAQRMVDRLSLMQLRRLGSLGNFKDEDIRAMSVDRFMHNIRSLKDAEIITVTTTSLVACAI